MKKFLPILLALSVMSCKEEKPATMKAVDKETKRTAEKPPTERFSKTPHQLFSVNNFEWDGDHNTNIISLSDVCNDSVAISDEYLKDKSMKNINKLRELPIKDDFRRKFFAATHISEADTIYILDYRRKSIEKLPVKSTETIALLTPYATESGEQYITKSDYMIGFKAPDKTLDSYNSNLVAIGKQNPFAAGQLSPLKWKKIQSLPAAVNKYPKASQFFRADFDRMQAYIQDIKDGENVSERYLSVVEDEKLKYENHISLDEDDEFSELLMDGHTDGRPAQWAGKMFQDQPPVIFGFVDVSFGCKQIYFIDKNFPPQTINCDNRH